MFRPYLEESLPRNSKTSIRHKSKRKLDMYFSSCLLCFSDFHFFKIIAVVHKSWASQFILYEFAKKLKYSNFSRPRNSKTCIFLLCLLCFSDFHLFRIIIVVLKFWAKYLLLNSFCMSLQTRLRYFAVSRTEYSKIQYLYGNLYLDPLCCFRAWQLFKVIFFNSK